jgi:hypothetical protein
VKISQTELTSDCSLSWEHGISPHAPPAAAHELLSHYVGTSDGRPNLASRKHLLRRERLVTLGRSARVYVERKSSPPEIY